MHYCSPDGNKFETPQSPFIQKKLKWESAVSVKSVMEQQSLSSLVKAVRQRLKDKIMLPIIGNKIWRSVSKAKSTIRAVETSWKKF